MQGLSSADAAEFDSQRNCFAAGNIWHDHVELV
jgi:hypothetical protein